MFVKPRAGVKVRDPQSAILAHIPETGCDVPESSYWIRRIRSGDVVLAERPVVQVDQIPDSIESTGERT